MGCSNPNSTKSQENSSNFPKKKGQKIYEETDSKIYKGQDKIKDQENKIKNQEIK